jgi:diacylglycerol kinase (ATP)
MAAKVILNPYAGRWMALRRKAEAEQALRSAGVDYDLVVTAGPGDATQLAIQAVEAGFSPIIAAGGDGTISEVVNGMAQANHSLGKSLPVLGVLPLGSGNDLVFNLSMPKDLPVAAQVISQGCIRELDLCQVNERYFDNNAAIGLEPYITLIQQRIKRVRGVIRYLLATLKGIYDNPRWTMQMEWQNGSYEGPVSLVTVGNNPRTGGLFYVTPHADPFDGQLTFVYGFIKTRLEMLRVLPMLMKPGSGNYTEHPAIHEIHSPYLRVYSQSPTPLHADGEIQSSGIQKVDFKLYPQKLPILLPGSPEKLSEE